MARIQGDLAERSLAFALGIIQAVESLPRRTAGWEIGRQLIRSGTGIGANVREADHAISDADFAQKCSLARKEASETNYWLELCLRAGLLRGEENQRLAKEADELTRVLAAIVKGTQRHIAKKNS